MYKRQAFRRWDGQRAIGPFSLSAYEVVAVGLGSHHASGAYVRDPARLRERVRSIWSNPDYLRRSGSGARASWRLPHLIPLGRELLADASANI